MGYGRTYGRRPQPTGPRPNRFDGACVKCKRKVPAGTGILTGSKATGYEVKHNPERKWIGPPCGGDMIGKPGMGRWSGGCEEYADQPEYVAPARKSYAYTSGGARMTSRYGRCEDAPCCGCCD